ncbi:MAG: M56 family metallopeptidase [Planctomycetota bacterium]
MSSTGSSLQLFELIPPESLILLLCKLTLVLGFVFMLRKVFSGQSASFRHWVLTMSLVAMPAIVLAHFWTPVWSVPDFGLTSVLDSEPVESIVEHDIETTSDSEASPTGWVAAPLGPEVHDASNAAGIGCDSVVSWSANNPFADIKMNQEDLVVLDPASLEAAVSDEPEAFRSCSGSDVIANNNAPDPAQVIAPVEVPNSWNSGGYNADGWKAVMVSVWLVVFTFLMARLLLAWTVVSRIAGRSNTLEESLLANADESIRSILEEIRAQNVRVLVSARHNLMPCGIGIFKKSIILPADCYEWTVGQWKSVLLHEFAHFERNDCRTNLVARIHQAVLWFHPLAWSLVRQLRFESELACDDRVLLAGVSRFEYADLLLQFARHSTGSRATAVATVTMSDPRPLESRMKSVLRGDRKPLKPRKWQMAAVAILLATITLPVATAGVGSESPDMQNSTGDSTEEPAGTPAIESDTTTEEGVDSPVTSPESVRQEQVGTPTPRFTLDTVSYGAIAAAGDFEITVRTEFGHATFESDSILSVQRVGGYSDRYQIKSVGGSMLTGAIVAEGLSILPAGAEGEFADTEVHEISDSKEPDFQTLNWGTELVGIRAIRPAPLQAATITDGHALNGMSYHLRAPDRFNPQREYPGIVVLHGSNSNGASYIRKIVTLWPEIAERYILIGINGEQLGRNFDAENPRFNYTYINFAGKSDKYQGFPGTDRESPALVSEVISELRGELPISRLFVGGHSQGAFLTISVMMNYPELVDGAFPMAGGMLIQCEPEGYTEQNIRLRQRQTPVVLVHAQDDPSVDFLLTETAWRSYMDDSFPMIRLLDPEEGGHSFSNLPFDEAIEWLEKMTEFRKPRLLELALEMAIDGHKRDAVALLNQYEDGPWDSAWNPAETARVAETVRKVIDDVVQPEALRFERLIRENLDGSWIEPFLEFRAQYEFASSAQSVMLVFDELRSEHDAACSGKFDQALSDFRNGRASYSRGVFQLIVTEYYASRHYPLARILLEEIDQPSR